MWPWLWLFACLMKCWSSRQKPERNEEWYHNCKHPRSSVEKYAQCRAHQNISCLKHRRHIMSNRAPVEKRMLWKITYVERNRNRNNWTPLKIFVTFQHMFIVLLRHVKLTLVECHAVLLPGAALVNPARVGIGTVIGHWHPGEATNVRWHQGDIGTASDLNMRDQVDWSIWVGGSHKSPILSELAEWAWDLVGLGEFTVNLEVLLNVCKAGEHLWPSRGVPEPGVNIQEAGFLVWVCGADYTHHTWQISCW